MVLLETLVVTLLAASTRAGVRRQATPDPDRIVFEDEDGRLAPATEESPTLNEILSGSREIFINGQYVNSDRYKAPQATTDSPEIEQEPTPVTAPAPTPSNDTTIETDIGWLNHSSRKHVTVHRHKSRDGYRLRIDYPPYFRANINNKNLIFGNLQNFNFGGFVQPVWYGEGSMGYVGGGFAGLGRRRRRRSLAQCLRNCPTTPEYNPVCGDDAITYTNPGKLHCRVRCGKRIQVVFYGNCVRTTTARPRAPANRRKF